MALKRLSLLFVFALLPSCAVFDYVFDATKLCEVGQYHVRFVEIATEVVRVKCVTEGQLDVVKQDSTIQIIDVAYITKQQDPEE